MKTSFLALLLGLAAAPAAAQWSYDPAPQPSGRATGAGTGGVSVAVECGNGGLPAVLVEGYDPGAAEDIFVWEVDRYGEFLVAGSCTGPSCLLTFDSIEEAESTITGLRVGARLALGLYRRGALSEVPLGGSDAAIGAVLARSCDFVGLEPTNIDE
ncbi:hypothetical protein [Wenxinia marina]|nr:hypothetical protein [Wenxinia marina]GGL59287.1 hypothetical protein GCM10011392_12230 [Wenxinia marina]